MQKTGSKKKCHSITSQSWNLELKWLELISEWCQHWCQKCNGPAKIDRYRELTLAAILTTKVAPKSKYLCLQLSSVFCIL